MIKIDLARTLAERMDITIKDADDFLSEFMDVIGETLEKGEKIQLAGFGLFDVRYVPEHVGRNPKTGESLTIPACYYPIFKAGKGLKERAANCKKSIPDNVVTNKETNTATPSKSTPPAKKKRVQEKTQAAD